MRNGVVLTGLLAAVITLCQAQPSEAAIPTCSIHNGMKIWFLEYADDDYNNSHPLGVLSGVVDIHEREWHKKCASDGPDAKVYVPFNYRKNGKSQWDTRWPQDIYASKEAAERAYRTAQ